MANVHHANETVQLTLTLPWDVAQHLRDQIATGLYASESEYIQSMLQSETLFSPIAPEELTGWINTEGVRRLRAMEADPSRVLTDAEVFDFLDENAAEDEAS